ncbi:MAG: hypothetical protein AAFO84_03830 [Cyanobacteria bacterium J06598_1]
MAKLGVGIAIATGSLVSFAQPGLALSEEEKFTLCSNYPHNSQCEGYDTPIPLSRREGEVGLCALNAAGVSVADVCKVGLSDTGLLAYVEVGESISLMDDQRRTQVYEIPTNSIVSITYSEDESVNSDRLVRNTFLFGIWGAAFTQPDKISQVEVGFVEGDRAASERIEPEEVSTEAAAPEVSETSATAATPSNLVFESGRPPGAELRDGLETATGLTAQIGL